MIFGSIGVFTASAISLQGRPVKYYMVEKSEFFTSPVFRDAHLLESYKDFVMVETREDIQSPHVAPIYFNIRLPPNVDFDPLVSMPSIPQGMGIDFSSYSPDDMVYAVLQFKGPIKQEWRDAAVNYGIDLIQPESGFSFLAYGKKSAFESFAKEPMVRWYGPFHPYYKLRNGADYALNIKENTWRKFNLWVFDQEKKNLETLKNRISALGARIYHEYQFKHYPIQMEFYGRWDMVPAIARMDGVYFIEPRPEYYFFNDQASWVLQTNQQDLRSIFDHGITGKGVILAVADTGVDQNHPNFAGKIVRYWPCADNNDGHGHGTHVSGTVLGDGGTQGKYDPSSYDGMSFESKLSMQDIATGASIQCAIPSQNAAEAVKDGAIVEQNSWGGGTDGSYGSSAEDADTFMWDNSISSTPYFLFSFSNGNSGPGKSTSASPANAKDVMAVGATEKGLTKDIASFSSRGPTQDGRYSPTIVAPGVNTMSAKLGGGYTQMSGTSMSGPAAAGMLGLVAQYFMEGWYPGGTKGSGPGFQPSGTLLKAMAINSGSDQNGGNGAGGPFPNNDQGWGKILLEDVLYFDGEARKLWVEDVYTNGKNGLKSGESVEYPLTVKAGQPLKITLVWADVQGNGLRNDLNLKVTAPGGTEYLGNVFSNGESQTGGSPDNKNTNEQVYLKNPPAGDYIITVSALNVGTNEAQKFALVATGDVEGGSGIMVSSPKAGMYKGGSKLQIEWKSFGTIQDGSVKLEYTLDGSTWKEIVSGQPKAGSYQWTTPVANSSGGGAKVRASGTDSKGQTITAEGQQFMLDSGPPDTKVEPLPSYILNRTFDIRFTAIDNLVGVERVQLKYRVNNGSYMDGPSGNVSPFKFTASQDGRFEFYTIGTDKVGNVESPPATPDAVTNIDTLPPSVVKTNPPKDAMGVSILTAVNIEFSEPMSQSITELAFKIAPSVPGKMTWSGNTMTFKPDSQLSLNTKYTVTIARSAKDLAGHEMKDNYSFSFTTTPNPPNPGNVEGHVYDAITDEPIEGAEVIAYFGANFEVMRARTDSSGAYKMTDIDAGSYTFKAVKTDYKTAWKNVTTPGEHKTLSGVDFRLFSLGSTKGALEVCVFDTHFTPLSGAEVWLGNATSNAKKGSTGSNGCLVIKPLDAGVYTVEVKKEGFKTNKSTGQVVKAGEVLSITVYLDKAPFTWDQLFGYLYIILAVVIALIVVGVIVRVATRRKCPVCGFTYKKKLNECPVCGYNPMMPPGMMPPGMMGGPPGAGPGEWGPGPPGQPPPGW